MGLCYRDEGAGLESTVSWVTRQTISIRQICKIDAEIRTGEPITTAGPKQKDGMISATTPMASANPSASGCGPS